MEHHIKELETFRKRKLIFLEFVTLFTKLLNGKFINHLSKLNFNFLEILKKKIENFF